MTIMSDRIGTIATYSLLFIISASIFLLHYLVVGQAVYGDGIGYYSHLHSWVIDQDFDFTNEYQHIYSPENNNAISPKKSPVIQIVSTSPSGKAENFYSPGVGILLLPFYLIAHWMSLILSATGFQQSLSGYGDLYQIFSGLGAVLYTILGLFFLERILTYFSGEHFLSRLSVIMIFFATQLLYYGSFDVINSHFASFFLTSLFFWIFFSKKELGLHRDILLGFLAGLLTLNRLQDGAVVILWGIEIFQAMKSKQLKNYAILVKKLTLFISTFVIVLLPLILHLSQVYSNIQNHEYVQAILTRIQNPQILNIFGSLFHPVTGLFIRTPLIFLLFIYWLSYRRTFSIQLQLALKYLFSFFFIQFLIITIQGGWYAAAYGGRMYISSLVFFALILVLFLQQFRKDYRFLILFVSIFISINLLSMANFVLFEKGAEGERKGTESRTLERIKRFKIDFFK